MDPLEDEISGEVGVHIKSNLSQGQSYSDKENANILSIISTDRATVMLFINAFRYTWRNEDASSLFMKQSWGTVDVQNSLQGDK